MKQPAASAPRPTRFFVFLWAFSSSGFATLAWLRMMTTSRDHQTDTAVLAASAAIGALGWAWLLVSYLLRRSAAEA